MKTIIIKSIFGTDSINESVCGNESVWLGAPANAHISPSFSAPFQANYNKCFMNVNALYREIWHIFLGPHPLLSFAFRPKSTQSLQMGYH